MVSNVQNSRDHSRDQRDAGWKKAAIFLWGTRR